MQSSASTINSVQSFMRFMVFVVTFIVFYLIAVLPLSLFFDSLSAGSGSGVTLFGMIINIF